jgi:3-methyladenine DNA glycosylase AlkD
MNSEVERATAWVGDALRRLAIPERREFTERYFPSAMEILGVPAPQLRSLLRQLHGEWKEKDPEEVLELALAMSRMQVHECRQAAYELLDRRRDARRLLGIQKTRALGRGNDNWASVDAFSVLVSGPVWREGQLPDREVLAWAGSKDRWWRRTALVSTVPLNLRSRGGFGDVPRTLRVCETLVGDSDPMVAKGLSWALRAAVGVDREAVETFLRTYEEVLAALVRREVRNKLETGRKSGRG